MRALVALLAVNLLFIGAALLAAGTILALGRVANESPLLANEPWTWLLICLAGVAAAIAFLWFVVRFIGRSSRRRAPGPG